MPTSGGYVGYMGYAPLLDTENGDSADMKLQGCQNNPLTSLQDLRT